MTDHKDSQPVPKVDRDESLEPTDYEGQQIRQRKHVATRAPPQLSGSQFNPESESRKHMKIARFQTLLFMMVTSVFIMLQAAIPSLTSIIVFLFPLACVSSFLIQLILYLRITPISNTELGLPLMFYFNLVEMIVVLFLISLTNKDPFTMCLVVGGVTWKNYYYIRQRFLPHDLVLNQRSRRYEEAPKQKFMGSPYVLILIQLGVLWIIHFFDYSHRRQDIFMLGVSSQILVEVHWAYLQRIGRKFRIHSVLGYMFVISEAFIITILFPLKENKLLVLVIFLYTTVKSISILEYFFNFDGSYRFIQSFDFIGNFMKLYMKEAISITLNFVLSAIFYLLDVKFFYAEYRFFVLVLLSFEVGFLFMLRMLLGLITDSTAKLCLYFLFIIPEAIIVSMYMFLFRYAPLSLVMTFILLNWKNCYVIREHFKTKHSEAQNRNEQQTNKLRKGLYLLAALNILITTLIDVLDTDMFKGSIEQLVAYKSYYFLSALGLSMFILFEIDLVPVVGLKVPFNIVMFLSYMLCQIYIVWAFDDSVQVIDPEGSVVRRILLSVLFCLKDVSVSVVMRDDQVEVVGNTSGVSYEVFDDDEDD